MTLDVIRKKIRIKQRQGYSHVKLDGFKYPRALKVKRELEKLGFDVVIDDLKMSNIVGLQVFWYPVF